MTALVAAGCVDSGNRGWDLGRWSPPLVAQAHVEAFRGVHEGRIGLRCMAGGTPTVFVETWRPVTAGGAAVAASMTYRIGGEEHSAPGRLGPHAFELPAEATPELLRQLEQASRIEVLVPLDGGGVYPVTFDVSDFAHAHDWVRDECRQL
ncbi:MAG TPA: hypothetical protein VEB68_06605 [Croceibacterium sp.]|nr:hypothetical protein [Croceibacterium sp.]